MESLELNHDALAFRDLYAAAEPFPHAVFDRLFDDSVLDAVLDNFPGPQGMQWARFDNPLERKLGYFFASSTLPAVIRDFLNTMNSFEMLLWLEELTGIEGLIPDPYFGGGGLHQIEPGGFLKIHADFNVHPKLKLDRRLNMLIYLNKDWQEEYGGHLELWSRDGKACQKRILPIFNRTVIFSTTDTSYHGHPHPLASPAGVSRKSVSLYYYTVGRPDTERSAPHDTVFIS